MNIEDALVDRRTSQATIGLTPSLFESLLPLFEAGLKQAVKENPYRGGRHTTLRSTKEKLFFVLYYLKNYPTYDVLGLEFGMHRSNAFRNINRYMLALKIALSKNGALPSESITGLNYKLKDVKLIIIDGTEQRRNRPKNKEKQKKYYSGKKNAIR